MIVPDQQTARRLITHLKAGTTPLDCVEFVNVGHERWLSAAEAQFDEIELDGDSLVRFIKGYYGDGKTHFMGMLRAIAFRKGWCVTYVTAEDTPLHKYDIVYGRLVRNLSLAPHVRLPAWLGDGTQRGASALLASVFARLYHDAYRLNDKSGLDKERVLQAVRVRVRELAAHPQLHELMGRAVTAGVEAILRDDETAVHSISAWLEGEDVRLSGAGLTRRVDQKMSRDATRGLSVLTRFAGMRGVLILIDEAERILAQSRGVRNKCYGVLRDLLDNADGQGGMEASVTYVAATPEMFDSEKGFPEYDALRSRLTTWAAFTPPALIDWRGVVVDLANSALSPNQLQELVGRVRDIHSCARQWDASQYFGDEVVSRIVQEVLSRSFAVSAPRLLGSYTATLLEIVEQNREQDISSILGATLQAVNTSLDGPAREVSWE